MREAQIYERFRDAIRNESPAVLVTVIADARSAETAEARSAETAEARSAETPVGKKFLLVSDPAPAPDTSTTTTGTATNTSTTTRHGDLGNEELTRVVERDALGMLDAGLSEVRHYGPNGEARQHELSIFIESHARRPQMVIFGAVDFTRALADQAKLLGYRVTVCDAREVFATKKRFPSADEVIVDWPDRLLERIGDELGPRDAVCVLTHDAKFDVPAIVGSLRTRAGYIGVMGSRKTHDKRTERLKEVGVTEAELARLRSPLGLDIGGRTPEETAVSITAEIIALRTKRAAPSLTEGKGAIH